MFPAYDMEELRRARFNFCALSPSTTCLNVDWDTMLSMDFAEFRELSALLGEQREEEQRSTSRVSRR